MNGASGSDEHRYHALPPREGGCDHDEEAGMEDAVWDQLNDQQSREVQQHESRFQTGDPYGRDNPLSIAWSMAHQTTSSAGDLLRQTAQRARVAVRDWQQVNHGNNDDLSPSHTNCSSYPYSRTRRGMSRPDDYAAVGDEFDLQFGISDLLRRGGESSLSLEAEGENHKKIIGNRRVLEGPLPPANHDKNDEETEAPAQPLQGYPFVVLKEGRDVPNRNNYLNQKSERDRWGMVGNLDVFLTHLYKYYYHRGLTPMLCSFAVETCCLLFTIWLTRLLLIGVDWPKLMAMKCDGIDVDEESDGGNHGGGDDDVVNNACYPHLSSYARTDPLSWTSYLLIQGYTLLLLVYAGFKIWMFYHDFFGYAIQCRTILHDKLGLSERKLQGGALSWNDVVTKLVEGQESGSYKIIHHYSNTEPNSANGTIQNSYSPPQHNSKNNNITGERDRPSQTTPTNTKGGNASVPAAPPSAAFNLPANPSKLQHANRSLLDPLQIAQRIMRKENFMVAFWNAGLLECTKVVFPWNSSDGVQRYYWCGVLEWSFYQCVLNFMFNHKYELRPAFCLDSDALKRRLKVCGVVHLCLLPFLLVFVVLHFFLRHVYVAKSSSSSSSSGDGADGGGIMGHPRWSSAAAWQFREFNELPHAFEKRMEPSYKEASKYCNLFGTSEYLAAIGRLLVFFGGAIGGILLVLGVVVSDGFLLHVQLWGRNLVWYAGMAGIVYSIGRALEPAKEATPSVTKNLFEDMDVALKRVSQHTHYYPEHWKGRGWDSKVYSSFKMLFDSEVKLFLHELVALVLTPYILFFRLSEKAPEICEFCLLSKTKLVLSANTSTTTGTGSIIAGDVCGFSTFDFDTYGDEAWEGRTLGKSALLERRRQEHQGGAESLTESILRGGNLEEATRLHPKPRARHGKMEKSFFTFHEAHPNWESCFPPSGQSLVNRVEEYRLTTEQAKVAREREFHVQAATRQLEMLARIEEEQSNSFNDPHRPQNHQQGLPLGKMGNWNPAHHGRTKIPAADAGAGSQNQSPSSLSPLPTIHTPVYEPEQQARKPGLQHRWPAATSGKNGVRGFAEHLSAHADHLSLENPPSVDTALPVAVSDSLASENRQQIAGNGGASYREEGRASAPSPEPPRSAESRLFESRIIDSSLSPGVDVDVDVSADVSVACHQLQPGLALSSSSRSVSLMGRADRGSQNQYHWLERFHEDLEKQQEDINLQQRSYAGTSPPEELNPTANHASGATPLPEVRETDSLPADATPGGNASFDTEDKGSRAVPYGWMQVCTRFDAHETERGKDRCKPNHYKAHPAGVCSHCHCTMGGNGGSPKTRKRKHNGDAEADAGADTDPNPPGDGSSCKDPEQDGEALAQREALAQSEADDLEDLLLIAAEAALIEFDETTGRPVRIAGNASASGSASGDEGNAPIDGLLKISRRMLRNQAEDLFEDLKGIHAIVKDRVRTHEMVPWAGTDGDTKRLRAFGFLGSPALERLDRSGAVRLHAPEKTGAEALRDERANRRAICVLDPAGEPLPAGANDRRERAAAVVRKRTVRPAEVADKLCAAILGSGSGNGDHHPLDPSLLSSGSLIAYQTNLHNGAKHLGAHLDAPLHEGFGKVIVTVAVRGSATILLIGKGTGGDGDGGDDEGEQPAWRFRVEEGEAYVLSGNARNACLHAVLADDGGTGGGGGGHRESLNLRFGIHTVEEAERDIKRHWPDLW